MAYEIHTFGNGEILKGIFDALAMCLNGQTGVLFEPLKRLGLILGAFWAAIYALYGDQIKAMTHWIIPMTLIMNLLFLPSTSVWIHDPVTRFHQKVDHVPYGLAAFAGYVSTIGHVVTEQVEKIFTLPDDLRYQKSGSLLASHMIQQAKTFRITNTDLSENMRSFVGQCIMYDALLGRKYTIEDLRHSDDLWKLVSENASPVRSFMWRDPGQESEGRRQPAIITCRDGVKKFNALWGQELDRAATIYGKKIFGKNALVPAKTELLKYLPLAYTTLGDMAKSATDILHQQMMIDAVVEGVETSSAALGNAPHFASRRAYLQQRATYETLGAMAGDTLPTMKAVLEAIAYACFLFVIPLSILPFGWRFLLSWAQILLWLQMWAPLYAILNYIMTMAARSKTLATLSISNEAGVTLASSVGLANLNADITAMAGYLAMSIPFLCIALVKGVGSFVHMASHLGNVSQSSAGMAASEVTSGNFSLGNISEGNVQMAQVSMFTQSRAASYKAGSFQLQDGRVDTTAMADGSQVVTIGMSHIPVSLNAAETMSDQQSEMATQAYHKGLNLSESSAQHLSGAMRSAVSLSETLSHLDSTQNHATSGVSTEQSTAVHTGANLVRDFARQHNVSTEKAANFLAEASVGLGLGKNAVSSTMKGHLNAQDQEMAQKAQKYAEDHHVQDAMREASQASRHLSHNLGDEKAKRWAKDLSTSYDAGVQTRKEASKSFQASDAYSTQAMVTRSQAATINRNANQEFMEWMARQPAENAPGRLGYQGASHVMEHNPDVTMGYAQRFLEEKGLGAGSSIQGSSSSLRHAYESETGHQRYGVLTPHEREGDPSSLTNNMTSSPLGEAIRHHVAKDLHDHHALVQSEARAVRTKGQAIQERVVQEGQKGVARRLGEKGIDEVKAIRDEMSQEWREFKK